MHASESVIEEKKYWYWHSDEEGALQNEAAFRQGRKGPWMGMVMGMVMVMDGWFFFWYRKG